MVTTWHYLQAGGIKKAFPDMVQFSLKSKLTHSRTHPFRPEFFFASHEAKLSMKKTGILFFAPTKANVYKSCGELSLSVQCTTCTFGTGNSRNLKK